MSITDARREAADVPLVAEPAVPVRRRPGVWVTDAPGRVGLTGDGGASVDDAPRRDARNVVAVAAGDATVVLDGLPEREDGEDGWTDRREGVREMPLLGVRTWPSEGRPVAAGLYIIFIRIHSHIVCRYKRTLGPGVACTGSCTTAT